MSCRVLNRTVEQEVFEFILKKANGKQVNGEYIPTEKTGLAQSLFKTLGFEKNISDRENNPATTHWIYANYALKSLSPKHYVSVNEI